jgi:hypothetical protein
MTTANAVSRSPGITRAEVIAHVTQANEETVVRREVSQPASPPIRTDIAPRATAVESKADNDEIYEVEFGQEVHHLTVAAEC